MRWSFTYYHKKLPHVPMTLTVDIDAETEQDATDWFSEHCSQEPSVLVSTLINPSWLNEELHKKLSALMHELDRALEQINQTADYYETEARNVKLKLLLERFDGLADAIEILCGTRIHFSRTDDYIVICDDEERYLLKVIRK